MNYESFLWVTDRQMREALNDDDLVHLSGAIVAAYVTHNPLSASDLPEVLQNVHGALVALGQPPQPRSAERVPAVPIRRSVTPDAISCLDCGRHYKAIKRHLQTSHGLTPSAYRERWKLPFDYPLVAPNYAAMRSSLAKSIGLGQIEGGAKKRRRAR